MKIYIIPAWYPQNENDITACFFREQAHALADSGHDVTVIHIEPISVTQIGKAPLNNKREWQDGNVRTFFHKVIVPIPAKLTNIQDNYISDLFYKIIKNQIEIDKNSGLLPPNILHAHVSHSCAYYCLKASKKLNIPLVVTEHYSGLLLGTATQREYKRVHDTIEKSDAFIFVGTNFCKTITEKLNTSKATFVIPNMLPSSLLKINHNNKQNNKQKKSTQFTFLVACHLTENKSVDLVIKAFHETFKSNENVRLIVAGDGEKLDSLRCLAKSFNDDRISFYGRYSREECVTLFSESDAFVLTSKVETFGIVYLEALSCGIPCIGTKGQGADDIIDDSCGILVEYGNTTQLVEALRKMYYSKWDSEMITKKCYEKFSQSNICDSIEEVYNTVLRKYDC